MADEKTLVSLSASGALGILQGNPCEEWEVASRKGGVQESDGEAPQSSPQGSVLPQPPSQSQVPALQRRMDVERWKPAEMQEV